MNYLRAQPIAWFLVLIILPMLSSSLSIPGTDNQSSDFTKHTRKRSTEAHMNTLHKRLIVLPRILLPAYLLAFNYNIMMDYMGPVNFSKNVPSAEEEEARLLHDKAMEAAYTAVDAYGVSHPSSVHSILSDIRNLAIEDKKKDLSLKDTKEVVKIRTDLKTFFDQHPSVKEDAAARFAELTGFRLTPPPPPTGKENLVPDDWAHVNFDHDTDQP